MNSKELGKALRTKFPDYNFHIRMRGGHRKISVSANNYHTLEDGTQLDEMTERHLTPEEWAEVKAFHDGLV